MSEQNADLSSVLQKLLSDPQMLRSAMETAGKLKASGLLDGLTAKETGETGEAPPAGEIARPGAYGSGENAYTDEDGKTETSGRAPLGALLPASGEALAAKQRKELLAAVRPFLSRERQERVDGILKILQILEVVRTFGASGVFL